MPVNEPTHAHGQGYTDLNFLIPELATNVTYTKGPYYADEGDFASVGSVHVNYLDILTPQVSYTEGTLGYDRFFGGGSLGLGEGNLLGALEWQHYNGPWVNPDELHKINAVLRYSVGDNIDGYSLSAMYYHGGGMQPPINRSAPSTRVDQPLWLLEIRAMAAWHNAAVLTAQLFKPVAGGELHASAYLFGNH